MKKILVLGGLTETFKNIEEQVVEWSKDFGGYEFFGAAFDNLLVDIAPDNFSIFDYRNNREISEYDLVMFRGKIARYPDIAYCVSRYLENNKVPYFNDYSNFTVSSKITQAVVFYEINVPFARTIYSLSPELLKKAAKDKLSLPFILKDNFGSHGYNNHLITSIDQLNSVLSKDNDLIYLLQEYHPNNCDYRILIIGNKVLQVKRKARGNSHLNNTSQGGTSEVVKDLPKEIIDQAKKIASRLKMTMAGVDALQDKNTGEYYFLEVNFVPQMISGAALEDKNKAMGSLLADILD